jgi:hypothetical protein
MYGPRVLISALLDNRNRPKKDLSGLPTTQELTTAPRPAMYTARMRPNPGEIVILTAIPRGMLDDLPEEDQRAIKEIVGKPVLVNEYDDVGRAALEFTDRDGHFHLLFVAPDFITQSGIDSRLELRTRVEFAIKRAFLGVGLGDGTSLRQAQMVDGRKNEPSRQKEITDNWSCVSLDELERNGIAHLDALGFRYYIPALMLSVLDCYDSSSMRVIGTLTGLYPKQESWEYHMHRYSLLDAPQKAAIAQFLVKLPELVNLDPEDARIVERALRNYWGEYSATLKFPEPTPD